MTYALRAILAIAFLLVLAMPAATAVSPTPVFVQTPRFPKVQITNANGTTAQTVYACATNGSKIVAVFATSTDTANKDVTLSVLKSAVSYSLTTVTVPLGTGTTSGVPPINLLSPSNFPGLPSDSDGNPYFYCESGDTIQAAMVTTLTSAKVMNIVVVGADF